MVNIMKITNISIDSKMESIETACKMNHAGLPRKLIVCALQMAFETEDFHFLLNKWSLEKDAEEREKTILEIQIRIEQITHIKNQFMYVRFDDLIEISKDVRKFKDNLRVLVDDIGGIKRLSVLTGIPQPSLSRFFNSATMPRRTTLYKIAKALKQTHVKMGPDFY